MNTGTRASVRATLRHASAARGFTLVEAMVVIVMMAILSALAMPGFRDLIERFRVERMASAFVASVTHARSEAVRRARTVRIEARAGCGGTDWSCGWDTVADSGGASEVLQRQDPDRRVGVTRSATGSLSFDAMGQASAAGVVFHPPGNLRSSNSTVICLSRGGRLKRIAGAWACAS